MLRITIALAAALVVPLALAEPVPASGTHLTLAVDDGTNIQATLYLPDGEPPANGWPAILMLHRLGGSRLDTNALAERFFVPAGYVVLSYDARGHRESGGVVSLAGPREIADVRELERWLAERDDVDESRIGAWGLSYGGVQAWLAAGFGVPFAALVTVEAWTDLYTALFPNDLPKSGVVGGLLSDVAFGRLDPALGFLRTDAIAGVNLEAVREFAAARSPLGVLGSLTTPTLIVQGRRDFAFGVDQAIAAFTALKGPKRIFFGHNAYAPSALAPADAEYALTLARRWFDRFLKGEPNGVDAEAPVEIAPDPWLPPPSGLPGLPSTQSLTFRLPGATTIRPRDRAVRDGGKTRRLLETFGSPVVHAQASVAGGWTRLIALLTAITPEGRELLVGAGGVPTAPGNRTYSITLNSSVTKIPRGSTLRVIFGANTTGTAGGLLYLEQRLPPGARLTLRHAAVSLPVWRPTAPGP